MSEEIRKKAEYRSSLRSKTLIKKALLKLMKEKSFDSITIAEIVKKADINRGTFYAHFHSTREVLEKIQDDMIHEIMTILEKYSADFIFENPRPVFQAITDYLSSDIEYARLLFQVSGFAEYIGNHKSAIFSFFLHSTYGRRFIRDGREKEFILVVDFWMSAIIDVYYDAVLERVPFSIYELPSLCCGIADFTRLTWFEKLLALDDAAAEPEKHK